VDTGSCALAAVLVFIIIRTFIVIGRMSANRVVERFNIFEDIRVPTVSHGRSDTAS